ncbi:N-acetylglucosamine-6-phosphate deacetylase [Lactococcus lactis]|nr:N-acetylglucosamine-6-phosphate deacetylase [Lactococcus lactis]
MKLLIKNSRIATHNTKLFHILVNDKKIVKVFPISESICDLDFDQSYDARGNLIVPGMIDVHIHGAISHDMMDGAAESIQAVSKKCLQTGCTGFLVTSVTASTEMLERIIDSTKSVIGHEQGAKILGIHLEGPYLNIEKKGMQSPEYIRMPDLKEMKKLVERAEGLIKMVTIAPELPGALEVVDYLTSQNIIVAAGHTNATYEEGITAFEHGVSHITHCCNAMPTIHHRNPGITVAALETEGISIQAIVDNIHLHPGMVRLMHKLKQPEQIVLITDALQAMGTGDGVYNFGGHEVTVKDGVARLSDGTLASSTVTMNRSLEIAKEMGLTLSDAITMASETPARLLGFKNRGKIAEGYVADFSILNEQYEVDSVHIDGKFSIFSNRKNDLIQV